MADDTTPPEDPDTEPEQQPETDQLGDGGKKALEAERTRARDADKRARQLEREIEKLKTASLSDQERAVAEAKAAGRQEASAESGKRLARAEIRAAAATKGLDVAEILEDLDLSRFVGDDGEPDDKAIAKAISRWAAIAPPSTRPRGDVDQGTRGSAAGSSMNELIRQAAGRG